MQEKTLFQSKEKLERKFYRTKSESLKLKTLNDKIALLHSGKQLLMDEFKEISRKRTNLKFNKKIFLNIIDELKMKNKELCKQSEKIRANKHNYEKDFEIKEKISKTCKKPVEELKADLRRKYKEKQNEINISFILQTKIATLTNDIEIVKNRVIGYVEMQNISSHQLKKIEKLRIIGEFKNMFSHSLLKQKKRNIQKVVKTSENNFGKQSVSFRKKKQSIDKLYDECAWMNLELKAKSKEHKQVTHELKEIGKRNHESEKLDNINQRVSEFYLKLKMIVENIENNLLDNLRHRTEVKDSDEFICMVEKVIVYFSDYNFNINQGYKEINVLQSQNKKRKAILDKSESSYQELRKKKLTVKLREQHYEKLENTSMYINTKKMLEFLFKSRNFIILFEKRLKMIINSINKICGLLDLEYEFKIMNKGIVETPVLGKNNGMVQRIKPLNLGSDDDLIEMREKLNQNEDMRKWLLIDFPYYGKYDPNNSDFADYILQFYTNIINQFDKFLNIMTSLVAETKGEFQFKKSEEHKSSNSNLNLEVPFNKQKHRSGLVKGIKRRKTFRKSVLKIDKSKNFAKSLAPKKNESKKQIV